MTRRLLALLALLALIGPAAAAGADASPPTGLQVRLARALRVPHVSPARSGALVVDLASGSVVYSQNGSRPFAPASNEKLTVSYAAMSLLGPGYRFETDVFGDGWQDGSVWRGALVLKGGGDPTLSHYGLRALAAKVRAAGVVGVGDDQITRLIDAQLDGGVLLLPLFFAFIGLRTQVGLLNNTWDWLICFVIIAVATVGKLGGTSLVSRMMKMSWRESLQLGALMNTRGLMELIVLNIGYDLGILSLPIFTMLVIMALVTTVMTGPLVTVFGKVRGMTPA